MEARLALEQAAWELAKVDPPLALQLVAVATGHFFVAGDCDAVSLVRQRFSAGDDEAGWLFLQRTGFGRS